MNEWNSIPKYTKQPTLSSNPGKLLPVIILSVHTTFHNFLFRCAIFILLLSSSSFTSNISCITVVSIIIVIYNYYLVIFQHYIMPSLTIHSSDNSKSCSNTKGVSASGKIVYVSAINQKQEWRSISEKMQNSLMACVATDRWIAVLMMIEWIFIQFAVEVF